MRVVSIKRPQGAPLSKEVVSRLFGRVSEDFESWRARDLANNEVGVRDPRVCGVSGARNMLVFRSDLPVRSSSR